MHSPELTWARRLRFSGFLLDSQRSADDDRRDNEGIYARKRFLHRAWHIGYRALSPFFSSDIRVALHSNGARRRLVSSSLNASGFQGEDTPQIYVFFEVPDLEQA